jgi:hypothetical protein
MTDKLKGSSLISFSVDGQGFALQGLNDKIGNHTTIKVEWTIYWMPSTPASTRDSFAKVA